MTRSAFMPRHDVMAIGLIALALVVYWPSATNLWAYWLQVDGTTQYGLLIAAISIWLLFRSREALAAAPIEPVPWALPALLVVGAGSLLFWRAGIETLQLALLPPLLLLAVLGALGTRVVRIVAFPVLFLYFAVPGWGLLWPSLQAMTIKAVAVIAPLVGLPAHVSGDLVTLPGVAVFEIGSKCSGVDFLIVGLAVAALIGELERASIARRAWLMALMGAISIVSNWVRVFLIIVIGYATHMRNPLATSRHLLFGWIVFAAALLLYLWLAPRSAPPAVAHGERAAGSDGVLARRAVAGGLATLGALALFPAGIYALDLAQGAPQGVTEMALPPAQAPWHGPLAATDPLWQPRFIGAHFERQFAYQGPDGRSVEVAAIGYSRRKQGRELVGDESSLVGKGGLAATAYGLATAGGQRFREITVEDGAGDLSVIWWVYDIGGRRFATPAYSELWYGLKALIRPPYSVLYALRTSCRPSCEAARRALKSFVESNGDGLFTAARESRAGPVGSHA
jgi:exosortase